MKCDHIRTREQGDTPFFPNMLNNANVEVCLKEDVDAAISELQKLVDELDGVKKSAELILKNLLDCGLIKEWYFNGKFNAILDADDPHLKIAELKQKLEDVQASMYCDVVDANMEVKRLKRALYIVLARSFCYMRELAARNALYDDECKWDNFKATCLKKAEEYR